ncbi:MAG: FkbM family methyltransferase [Chloroflexi bacterium]|nr:FkbM family methyltransferase [Chloroflexota bacterium]
MMRSLLPPLLRVAGHGPIDRGKYRLALWAYRHLRPLPAPQTVSLFNGLRMEIDPNEFVQSQIYYIGAYELYLARYVRQLLRPGSAFMDIGAHVGQYTLIAAGAGASVHTFEPNPSNFVRLQRNVELNALQGVTLNRMAVARTSGMLQFSLPDADNTGSGSLAERPGTQTVAVNATTIDAYCAEHGIQPDFIKMDIEGGELDALRSGEQILRARPALVLEASGEALAQFGHSCAELINYLVDRGYKLHTLARDRLVPMNGDTIADDYDNLICLPA